MADVRSLGVHTPVALPYLINEGYLPKEPAKESYQWQTYAIHEGVTTTEEEVLSTKSCVVWSQSGLVRAAYRFELEGEDVQQALLTSFPRIRPDIQPNQRDSNRRQTEYHGQVLDGFGKNSRRSIVPDQVRRIQKEKGETEPSHDDNTRALVVFLKTKAHVYYLHGSHYIVHLPFEIERAFAAPRGLLLQRKLRLAKPNEYQSPKVPPVPQNSFFSQAPTQSSFLLSPTLGKSFAGSQPVRPSPLGAGGKTSEWLNGLYDTVCGTHNLMDESEAAGLYTLTSPLSDLGLVTESLQHSRPKLANKASQGLNVEFDALDTAEKIVYVTSDTEWSHSRHHGNLHGNLMLIATVNREMHLVTIWHGWYIEERSLSSLMKRRSEHKAAKLRRRSSFLSASLNTGTTTPAVRTREVGGRESFAPGASLRVPNDSQPAQQSRSLSRKPARQDDEAVMASQMDPDFQPGASQNATRETRRISSLVSRADSTSQNAVNGSFGGTAGRRHTSFGPGGERRSFGPRRSRGSTPGSSIFRASVGLDDDTIDIDEDESIDSVVRHIRNTYEVAGAESVFGNMDDTFRPELNVRKIHSFSLGQQRSSPGQNVSIKIATLYDNLPSPRHDDMRLTVYIHDASVAELHSLSLEVKDRSLWPEIPGSTRAAIPMIVEIQTIQQSGDLIKLYDGTTSALFISGQGLLTSPRHNFFCPLISESPYRQFDAFNINNGILQPNEEVGRNRLLPAPDDTLGLAHPGPQGSFDEVDRSGTLHRRQLKLAPQDPNVGEILKACRLVLPTELSCLVLNVWYRAYATLQKSSELLTGTACDTEWVALISAIFYFSVDLVDEKTQSRLHASRAPSKSDRRSYVAARSRLSPGGYNTLDAPAWNWMDPVTAHGSPPFSSRRKDQLLPIAVLLAIGLRQDSITEARDAVAEADHTRCAIKMMLSLHIMREEQKLNILALATSHTANLAPVIAQIGSWLNLDAWGGREGSYYAFEKGGIRDWEFVESSGMRKSRMALMEEPVGVFEWIEHSFKHAATEEYPSLATVASLGSDMATSKAFEDAAVAMTPRLAAFGFLLCETQGLSASPEATVKAGANQGFTPEVLETLPEAVSAPLREAIARCEKEPPTTWSPALLQLVGRNDLVMGDESVTARRPFGAHQAAVTSCKDVQTICHALEQPNHAVKTREADRHAVSQLLFNEDRRLVEATSLMHFNSVQIAECPKQPDWSDAFHFEQQRKVMQWVTARTIALPAGDGMIHYDSQAPLMTEKYHLPGFSSSCVMQPMGHTVTTDRSGLTEEKVNWAYFHAGVSAGLRISTSARGIDTSWLVFNKPNELTNRHAGLLLALGLSGHLRSLAKWLSFKYLTPKHSMTSVGLLLGISASYMGTMDSLITRMLSVHITSMLPLGAAELNVSPTTQTAGLMGIGLLYYNTQHRRMSEIMLHEIENMDVEDVDNGPDVLRDESYRLAAGFALGFINLAKGKDLRSLYGMRLPERLLGVAVGPRPVNAVHVFDKATAGAIIAVALVYMKSGDMTIARRVDIPDTEPQFDQVRPDMLLLRTVARHLIMWDLIKADGLRSGLPGWISDNLPHCFAGKLQNLGASGAGRAVLTSSDVPFYNIATGLAWALSLRYAGSGNESARDEITALLGFFHNAKSKGDAYYYDAKLARSSLRRCIDVLALAAATVMAGTGDLKTFRYLRRLHGRTDAETPYGSHLAGHLAIGVLFLGGGTYTLGTSDLAVASLVCALYPLFPTDVHDNRVHLQAFRHLWVFAAEPRCIIVEDIDTRRPISIPLLLTLRDGSTKHIQAPCLLPELVTIATLQTADPAYWRVTLDFASNPFHLEAFRQNQRISVRRCPAVEAHNSTFNATLAALNATHAIPAGNKQEMWDWIFALPSLRQQLDRADIELILPPDVRSSMHTDERGTVVDDRLVLSGSVQSRNRDALWNLRLLFAWAEKARDEGEGRLRWIGREVVEALRAEIETRGRVAAAAQDAT